MVYTDGMTTAISMTLEWDEDWPGWKGNGTIYKQVGDATAGSSVPATSDFSPITTIAHLTNELARAVDVHPDNIDQITVNFSGEALMDAARRAAR